MITELVPKIKSAKTPGSMTTKVIAIDGPGGAGKSTLATKLSKELNNAPIIQTDDFASWDNTLGWWPRFLKQVLEPLAHHQPAHYQRYDWGIKQLAEWRTVQPSDYIIIEGVSSSREKFQPYLAFSVWVETNRDERLRRGLERDGEEARELWDKWMADEDAYIAREQPQKRANAVVSGEKQ